MIDKNAPPHYGSDLVKAPEKKCANCKCLLNSDNLVRNYGAVGYKKVCRACINKKSLKYTRKKAQILKDNPLW